MRMFRTALTHLLSPVLLSGARAEVRRSTTRPQKRRLLALGLQCSHSHDTQFFFFHFQVMNQFGNQNRSQTDGDQNPGFLIKELGFRSQPSRPGHWHCWTNAGKVAPYSLWQEEVRNMLPAGRVAPEGRTWRALGPAFSKLPSHGSHSSFPEQRGTRYGKRRQENHSS